MHRTMLMMLYATGLRRAEVRLCHNLRRFLRLTRVCFPKVTHLACNQDCN